MNKKNRVSRRDALKTFSVAAGAAAVPPWMAGCGPDDASDLSPRTGLSKGSPRTGDLVRQEVPIDTVVCVMMENRSFDNFFGALTLQEGRTDVEGIKDVAEEDDNGYRYYNEDDEGNRYYPTYAERMCVEDPPHQFPHGPYQIAVDDNGEGTNGGFVRTHLFPRPPEDGKPYGGAPFGGIPYVDPKTVMEYHDRKQLPFLYNLADDFALCDHWFCSFLGGTWTNRWYLHAAQSGGETSNNPEGIFDGTYDFEMIYDRLVEKGLTFKYYYTDVPFMALSRRFVNKFGREHIRPIREYYEDAASGNLPHYAMVDPGYGLNDDHPPHHVSLGQQFLSTVYHSLAEGPQWERSMLFITYDENGGFWDHVVPPRIDDVTTRSEKEKEAGMEYLGFRVPSVVAGPYVKQKVSKTRYEHTSVLAFLEWLYDLEPLTARDRDANNFVDVLDEERIRRREPRPAPIYPEVEVIAAHMLSACHYWSSESGPTYAPNDVHIAMDMDMASKDYDLRPYRLQTLRGIQQVERERVARVLLRR